MKAEWHYIHAGQEYGPVSAAKLHALAQLGQLLPSDQLWKEGMEEWKLAAEFPIDFPAEEESVAIVATPTEPLEEDRPADEESLVIPQENSESVTRDGPATDDVPASFKFDLRPKHRRRTTPSGGAQSDDQLPAFAINTRAAPCKLKSQAYASSKEARNQLRLLIGGGACVCLAVIGLYCVSSGKSAFPSNRTKVRSGPGNKVPVETRAAGGKAITLEQFHSVPNGALRFRVEDIFGSPLQSTHDVEEVEQFGSNGEIFGSQFVSTFMLAYGLSDKPGRVAVFVFQGSSTNPPMVEKHIE